MGDPGHNQIQTVMSQLLINAGVHKQELQMKQGLRKVSHSLQILYFS